jgi:hypothetical protein
MLRGPQTLGELKQRTERLHPFAGLPAVEEALVRLTARELGRWLERRPGQKEARYAHLLEDEDSAPPREADHAQPDAGVREPAAADLASEVARLGAELETLRHDVDALRDQLRS